MSLLNSYVLTSAQIGKFLDAIRDGQAPDKFTRQYLKDLGFKSSNHLAFIPLLKGLGFLTADGAPTQRYKDYLDRSRSKKILGEALKESYGDIFTIRAKPKREDKDAIAGKFRSTYNMSENVADLAARTFLSLLERADTDGSSGTKDQKAKVEEGSPKAEKPEASASGGMTKRDVVGLHYNIQIHLPPSKDIEVYNAIFKSLKEHLLG